MLCSGVLELSQDCIIKTCSVMHVKQWIGAEINLKLCLLYASGVSSLLAGLFCNLITNRFL